MSALTLSGSTGQLNLKKSKPSQSLTYRDAGVNIDAGDNLVENIKPLARRTLRPGVLAGIGGFGALFKIPKKYKSPVLVSGTDGVGTKLKLAFELKRHDTVGIDLVAMSVNDILTLGAEPLFFLDYYACGQLNVKNATEVVKGIALGCEQAGCALIGGETAEMPGMYPQGEYDLAGFAVGVVEQSKIINGQHIRPGDVILGLASNGAHSNGYSLIRKIISTRQINLSTRLNGQTLKNLIMEPTRIYVKPVLALHKKIPLKGIAHITGGGLLENVPRVLSKGLAAKIDASRWPRPALFDWLQSQGAIADQEMFRVFNCGIGLIIVLAPEEAQRAQNFLTRAGEKVWRIGEIVRRRPGGAQTLIE
jgi:phosphoribosylformylglycinamidine cyclo-ligase